jgi:hypothetical protein
MDNKHRKKYKRRYNKVKAGGYQALITIKLVLLLLLSLPVYPNAIHVSTKNLSSSGTLRGLGKFGSSTTGIHTKNTNSKYFEFVSANGIFEEGSYQYSDKYLIQPANTVIRITVKVCAISDDRILVVGKPFNVNTGKFGTVVTWTYPDSDLL